MQVEIRWPFKQACSSKNVLSLTILGFQSIFVISRVHIDRWHKKSITNSIHPCIGSYSITKSCVLQIYVEVDCVASNEFGLFALAVGALEFMHSSVTMHVLYGPFQYSSLMLQSTGELPKQC